MLKKILAPLSVKQFIASPINRNTSDDVRVRLEWTLQDTFYHLLVITSSTQCGGRQLYLVSANVNVGLK